MAINSGDRGSNSGAPLGDVLLREVGRGSLLGPLSGLGTDRDRAMAYERVGEICADQGLAGRRQPEHEPLGMGRSASTIRYTPHRCGPGRIFEPQLPR